jgi:carboxyl-terminal processing protease
MLTCEEPEGELVTLGNLENLPTRVEHHMVEGTPIGVLAFNIWMLPMVKRVEAAMADLRKQGMTSLVLDLRGNPGGVGAMSVPVARLLLDKPGSLGTLRFRDFEQEFNVEASDDPFTGPVAVLVDEGTASTSEIFAAGLRDLGRVTVVGGRASAGAALPSVIEELTGGAVLQYVVGDYSSPKGTIVEGIGVVPDLLVPETRADFAAGRDPVLEAAIAHLRKG